MATPEDTFKRTMQTKAALDAFRAFKLFQELIKSGVDTGTVFLQVFCGVYYAVPPISRPDFLTVSDLCSAMKEFHSYLSGYVVVHSMHHSMMPTKWRSQVHSMHRIG